MIGSSQNWPAIEQLFRRLLELPVPERAAHLESIGSEDPALRTALERLLAAHDEPDTFLDHFDHVSAAELVDPAAVAAPPAWIGRYRVLRQLGRGGMGVVYLAEDPRLGRQVALKLLPLYLHADARAERQLLDEARAACSLDHPHIATIYEVGQAEDGRSFIAMAYYDGATLRERLAQGPFPPAEAIRIGTQVAEGLAAAHAKGVVHRDIKPENILITTDGRAKILDFGLARMGGDAALGEAAGAGTIAYMSPEQVRGEPADARSDVWSLGVVLHELLAGGRPFTGGDAAVLHAIVAAEPAPLPALPVPGLAAIVERCLRKVPEERYPSAHEVLAALASQEAEGRRGRSRRRWWAGGLAAGAVVIAVFAWLKPGSTPTAPTVSNVRQLTRAPEPEVDPVFSPDGRFLAYITGWVGQSKVVVRDLRGERTFPLTADAAGAHYGARWTAEGDGIVFHTVGPSSGWPGWSGYDARSSVIPRLGGAVSPFAPGRVWDLRGDAILYTVQGSLLVQDRPGAAPRVLARSGLVLHSARFSPDGSRVAFVEGGADVFAGGWSIGNVAASRLRIVSTAGGEVVPVTTGQYQDESPAWLPDGTRLLFVSNRGGASDIYLLRVAADGRPASDPVRVTTGLDPQTISLSPDGRRLASARLSVRRNVWAVDVPARGSVSVSAARPVTVGNQRVENHGVSQDGELLLFDSNREGNQELFLVRLGRDEADRLTNHPADDFHPDLSPDGRTVAFYSTRYGTRDIFLADLGGGAVTRLTSDPTEEAHPQFSPDGNALVFELRGGTRQPQPVVAMIERVGPGAPWSPPRRIAPGWTPDWSPDGTRLVYEADAGIVIGTRDGSERVLVPRTWEGFAWPLWAPDGTIYYVGRDAARQEGIFAVAPDAGSPRMVVRLDDPRFKVQYGLSAAGTTLFLSLTEYESDIWTMDLDISEP